jgi:hypothetical protein
MIAITIGTTMNTDGMTVLIETSTAADRKSSKDLISTLFVGIDAPLHSA